MYPRQTVRAFLVFVIYLLTQLLSGHASAEVPDDIKTNLTGHGHALLIGVSKYDNNAWTELRSVTADLEDLVKGLKPHFATIDTLINPATNTIRNRLRELMTGRWNQPNERLLVYYAGHGFTDYNPSSRVYTGYITGRDTPACRGNDCSTAIGDAIPFNELDTINRETRALHVIMLFDSCFSGSIFMSRSPDTDPKHYDYQRARDALHTPVRYYITAGAAYEKIPADSPFSQLVLRGLPGRGRYL